MSILKLCNICGHSLWRIGYDSCYELWVIAKPCGPESATGRDFSVLVLPGPRFFFEPGLDRSRPFLTLLVGQFAALNVFYEVITNKIWSRVNIFWPIKHPRVNFKLTLAYLSSATKSLCVSIPPYESRTNRINARFLFPSPLHFPFMILSPRDSFGIKI